MTAKSLVADLLGRLTIGPAILAVVFAIKILFPIFYDPDFYWHLKTGEYIVSLGALPKGEVFTFTHEGMPWVHSEWLFQVLLFLVYKALGLPGVSGFVAILYTGCLYVNYLSCKRVLDDEAKAVITTLLFCATFGGIAPRPHLLTFLFLSITIYLLLEFKYSSELRRLWSLPALMVVWVNVHGGYFLGLGLLMLFAATEWTIFFVRRENDELQARRLKGLNQVVFVALLATLVNPSFILSWVYPFQVIALSGDTSMISEWQSPNFHEARFLYFLGTVFLFVGVLIYSRRKPDLTELAVPLVFVAGAFYSVRNIPLASLSMSPFFSLFLGSLITSPRDRSDWRAEADPLGRKGVLPSGLRRFLSSGNQHIGKREGVLNWILVGIALFSVALIYPTHTQTLRAEMARNLPVGAVDFVIRNAIRGRMFNTYHHGGYLIYRLFPEQKVFVYPRTDFFRTGYLAENSAIYAGDPAWKDLFRKYQVDYVICESAPPLRQLLLEGNDYRLVFDDGMHSVLVKDTDKYRKIIEQYGDNPAHG